MYCFRHLPTLSFYRYSITSSYQYERLSLVDWAMSALPRVQGACQTRQRLHINPNGPRTNNLSRAVVNQVCPMPRPLRPEGPYGRRKASDSASHIWYPVSSTGSPYYRITYTELQKCGISAAARSLTVWCSLPNSGARNAGTLLIHHSATGSGEAALSVLHDFWTPGT